MTDSPFFSEHTTGKTLETEISDISKPSLGLKMKKNAVMRMKKNVVTPENVTTRVTEITDDD